MTLPKPCEKCGVRIENRNTRHTKLCDDCHEKAIKNKTKVRASPKSMN